MSPQRDELIRNSDGLVEYVNSSARHRRQPLGVLGGLTLVVLIANALILATVLPFAYSVSRSITEEFCESAPGGRGYAGDKAPEEVSAVCSWARSG